MKSKKASNWQHYTDHWPITFKLTLSKKPKEVVKEIWNLRATDDEWEKFAKLAKEAIKLKPEMNAECNAYNVTLQIVYAAKASIGTKRVNTLGGTINRKIEEEEKVFTAQAHTQATAQ